ncbi:transglutaminase family protein [Pinisolibacter aquiterrae]|uniref:transglutaminase family protein n=1 Tax=Pinisolibacter aquiterrae TaxID=2815579 RepID=UPI001C3D9F2B|nr:transglutaminase family protein [Pinisolibacter aquiterrae]MBV5266462.1 transglutaminase family protein [Pinisolibacter aquiterrae]MCC8234721.1 transglutaminase family protein [Pinisolibacter aquiterrae]
MRLAITHETVYRFENPAVRAIQTLRLTPRTTENQLIDSWRIDVSQDCRLSPVEDAFGNLTHSFSIDGPIDELSIVASGEVVTEDTAGVLHTTRERLPLTVFRRESGRTPIEPATRAFAEALAAEGDGDRLGLLHRMMDRLHETIAVEPTTESRLPHEVLAAGTASVEDLAHLFAAAARALDIPARYVSGFLYDPEVSVTDAPHAWIEAHLGPALGWVGFDAAENCCPTDRWVRLAVGLDSLDTMAIRGVRTSFGEETVETRITVREIARA